MARYDQARVGPLLERLGPGQFQQARRLAGGRVKNQPHRRIIPGRVPPDAGRSTVLLSNPLTSRVSDPAPPASSGYD